MDLREKLARNAHESWSGWVRYMFSRCDARADGSLLIHPESVARWRRQMGTPYADLPEAEKERDRDEADKILEIVSDLRGGVMRYKIKAGAKVGQDFRFYDWTDVDVVFDGIPFGDDRVRLVAGGYGSSWNYGSGAVYAKKSDCIPIDDNPSELEQLRARLEKAEARLDRYEKIKTEAIKLVRLIESAGFCSIQIDMLRMAIGDAEEANREEG